MDTSDCSPDSGEIPAPPKPLSQIVQPRSYCVSCRRRDFIIDHGRCANCQGDPMRGCWHCGIDLSPEIEYEVARRWRAASNAVNDAWVSEGLYGRYRLREGVLRARKGGQR